jgi:hypothetical protein
VRPSVRHFSTANIITLVKSSIDYFYEGVSRWSFGFENPNMAAVVFVCLLPLLFALWSLSWDSRITRWLKIYGNDIQATISYDNVGHLKIVFGLIASIHLPLFPDQNKIKKY